MWDWLSNLFGTGGPDLGSIADTASTAADVAAPVAESLAPVGIEAANAAFTPANLGVSAADLGNQAFAETPSAGWGGATLGGTPEAAQGSSVAGSNLGGDISSMNEQMDPTRNPALNASRDAAVNSQQPPPPTAWESVRNAPGRWWQGASNEFSANPISTTLRTGLVASPFIAAAMAPSTPQPGRYTLNPPTPRSSTAPNTPIPAASPMSPVLTGTGGFTVGGQQGGQQKPAPGMAEGGMVGGPGLASGGQIPNYIKALTLHLQ